MWRGLNLFRVEQLGSPQSRDMPHNLYLLVVTAHAM